MRARGKGPGKGNRTRGPGRKTLSDGERALIAAIRAAENRGVSDDLIAEHLALLVHVARGDRGYCGRYIGIRLKAARELLDRLQGKPRQVQEHTGEVLHRVRIERVEGNPDTRHQQDDAGDDE